MSLVSTCLPTPPPVCPSKWMRWLACQTPTPVTACSPGPPPASMCQQIILSRYSLSLSLSLSINNSHSYIKLFACACKVLHLYNFFTCLQSKIKHSVLALQQLVPHCSNHRQLQLLLAWTISARHRWGELFDRAHHFVLKREFRLLLVSIDPVTSLRARIMKIGFVTKKPSNNLIRDKGSK